MGAMAYEGVTSIEAAERLGTTPEAVYELLFAGKIDAGPDADGQVRFPDAEVERIAALHLALPDPSERRAPPPLRASGFEGLTSIEAAERFGVPPQDLYALLFAGEIDGGPDVHGQVRFSEADVARLAAGKLAAS